MLPDFSFEKEYWKQGIEMIGGVDEVGRGSWAGPVVAAVVVFAPETVTPEGINDSKCLTPKAREIISEAIKKAAIFISIGQSEAEEINKIGIVRATEKAMADAVNSLPIHPTLCLVDGLRLKNNPFNHQNIIKGDSRSLSIAAASIIAKVYRDRCMVEYETQYPLYGFAQHKGYGTKKHATAILNYGMTKIHREMFVKTHFSKKQSFNL